MHTQLSSDVVLKDGFIPLSDERAQLLWKTLLFEIAGSDH